MLPMHHAPDILSDTPDCQNCGTIQAENALYCHTCGQKHRERLTFRSLFTDLATTYLGFDGIFFRTVKTLLWQPGLMVRRYLAGRQKPFIKPVQYYLLTLGLYFFITYSLGIDPIEIGYKINKQLGFNSQQENVQQIEKKKAVELTKAAPDLQKIKQYDKAIRVFSLFNSLFKDNIKIVFTILVPVFAFALWLLYRKSQYNYLEMLVLSMYVYGTNYFFSILQVLLLPFIVLDVRFFWVTSVFFFLSIGYATWATHQFFNTRGLKGWLLAIGAYLLTMVLYFVLVAFISIGVSYFMFRNP